ncbi:MAG: radical SAM/SPASM domain-containing protein [Thermodesulfovibrionales bacterium]
MEVTNACNLRCSMCFIYGEGVKRRRPTGFMKRDVWQQAIDEMGSWPAKVTLDLHGAGEPLLHPELFEIVSHAKSKGNISVGFLSNATLLTREKADAVIETGLDWIGFSVDGAQKEIFESYRKGAVLEEVEANIDYLLSIRKPGAGESGRPAVYLNMVCHPEADTGLFIDRWKGKVETILLSIKKINDKGKNVPANFSKPCFLLSQQLIMGWDGTTVLCCEDFCEDYVTGRFPEMSLSGIWHGSRFDKARQHHHKGTFDKIDLCRYCDSVVFHQYAETVIEVNGRKTLVRTELASKQE